METECDAMQSVNSAEFRARPSMELQVLHCWSNVFFVPTVLLLFASPEKLRLRADRSRWLIMITLGFLIMISRIP